MSDTPAETPAPADPEPERIHSIEDLSAKVDKIMDWIAGNKDAEPRAPEPEEEPASVAAEVQRELAKVKAAEERKAARDREKAEHDARLAAVEEKVKEKPPAEYRRVTKWMGWTGDES